MVKITSEHSYSTEKLMIYSHFTTKCASILIISWFFVNSVISKSVDEKTPYFTSK